MPSHKGLSLEVVKDHFFYLDLITLFIAPPIYNIFFYYKVHKLAEVPGVAGGILIIELKKLIIFLTYVISKGIHE